MMTCLFDCLFDGISNYVLSMHVPCACKLVLLYSTLWKWVKPGEEPMEIFNWSHTRNPVQKSRSWELLHKTVETSGMQVWNPSFSLLGHCSNIFCGQCPQFIWVHLVRNTSAAAYCVLLCSAGDKPEVSFLQVSAPTALWKRQLLKSTNISVCSLLGF